ncbi:hypothetical protein AB0G15_19625 [Streptosporangium sp. NPDC023825]|uniref:hypothetical protein n=1 Tax=Streptosporangium sp. NPDC023825 TaxID=3154909 RepID=UPI00341567CE
MGRLLEFREHLDGLVLNRFFELEKGPEEVAVDAESRRASSPGVLAAADAIVPV